MIYIIINADDFGINDKVTTEIEKLIKTGAISSTTIMANGESLDLAKKIVSAHPEISYGVHLCIDEFDSITGSKILYRYGIIDNDNKFIKGAIFNIKQFPKELKEAIRDELSAQIEKLLNMGFPISHIDSHHHFHTIYELKGVISLLMDKYKIEKVRISSNIPVFQILNNHISKSNPNQEQESVTTESTGNKTKKSIICRAMSLIKTIYFKLKINKYYRKKYKVTNGFESYSSFLNYMNVRKRYKKKQYVELMCHPGHLNKQYEIEANEVSKMLIINNSNYKLISYNEL